MATKTIHRTSRGNTAKIAKTQNPAHELLEFAREAAKRSKTWMELHNAIYGIGGKCSQLFPDQSARIAYSKSSEFREVAKLISGLKGEDQFEMTVPSGKFVLRIPESMHAALLAEAKAEGVSLNQLCVAKLASSLQSLRR